MLFRNLIYIASLLLLLSCSGADKAVTDSDFDMTETDNKALTDNFTIDENCDTVSLKYKLAQHEVTIQLNDSEINTEKLSDAKFELLKKWWDSLPQPLRNQIKSQEVQIELVSNVLSSTNNELKPEITDTRIENTGAALEKIIGESTGMTFTVKTKQLESNDNSATTASTNIVPYIKVPTGLAQFAALIIPAKDGISAQNIHSLQYWWMRLPDDLKLMIQNDEVAVEINCIAVDKGVEFRKNSRLGEKSDEYLFLINQYLQSMIGFKKMSKKNLPLGSLKMNSQIEKVVGNQSADYIIRINLRNQKSLSEKPSA
jgi:hypothetical protein